MEQNTFYTDRCIGYKIDRIQNYEIDDLCDFICVESILNHFKGNSFDESACGRSRFNG